MYTSAKPYFYGTGRRKSSVARVRLYAGKGEITINGSPWGHKRLRHNLALNNNSKHSQDI